MCVYRNDENLKQDEEKAWMVKIQKWKEGTLTFYSFFETSFFPFLLIFLLLLSFFFNGLRTTLFNNRLFFLPYSPLQKEEAEKQVKEKPC